jgi:TAG lipase/steryl ester hydrolase/phospholipase A2/LPA acyltransferase
MRAVCVQRKLVMLRETQLAMGRSALVLSGGAAIGCFHIGVVKTLLQRNLLPRVVVGSSAGAIVGVRPPC